MFRTPCLDPVFPAEDLSEPTPEDEEVFNLAPAFKYPEGAEPRHVDIVCIGAGMAAIYTSALARWRLKNFSLRIYERDGKAAGTWQHQKYPGCRCDVPSRGYVVRWEPNPTWSAEYVDSDEIERYFDYLAAKYFPAGAATYNAAVKSATWLEDEGKWELEIAVTDPTTGRTETRTDRCDFLISGIGILNTPRIPNYPGMDKFRGKIMHTARYDRSVDLTGKAVAVVGNGSTGIGVIGTVDSQASKLTCYQRRSTWIVAQLGQPNPWKLDNKTFSAEERAAFTKKDLYDFFKGAWTNAEVAFEVYKRGSQMSLFATAQAKLMLDALVPDPKLREFLTPSYPLGCRRITPHENYLAALQKPTTEVVRAPIARFTETGIVDAEGVERPTDVVILATGYEVTYKPTYTVKGRDGHVLQDDWATVPEGYRAVAAAHMPNFFTVYGPTAPVALNSINVCEEAMVSYIIRAIAMCQVKGIKSIAPLESAVRAYSDSIYKGLEGTVWAMECGGWYKNQTSGKLVSHYPGNGKEFVGMLREVDFDDFDVRMMM
ncbi:hypothetical protein DFJ74DRAFT_612008 [Hyaloraphidium curvatum]|nr:hypothetical protein DFJ74DRAFT_612008 [Hyaloraphidium curvatum]